VAVEGAFARRKIDRGIEMDEQPFETMRAPRDMLWPGDRRVAVVFNIAYEMWAPGTTSGVGPMGNMLAGGIFDPNADSYGRYNAQAGAERLLQIASRNGVPASVLTSAMVAESHAGLLSGLAKAGHEIVAHGYAQNEVMPILHPEQRARAVERSTGLLERATGRRPRGWISPRVTSGADTHRTLAESGYAWHGDVLDDDLPYMQRFPEGDILAIPMSVEFNDLPHALRFGRTPRQFVELVSDALDGLRRQPGEMLILDIFAHGHCYGRPAAAWAIDEIMKRCADEETVWITTRTEICGHCRKTMNLAAPPNGKILPPISGGT
jgi:peptidoglycan/xylan/chitin deacetylase (PgdA/CDA1 family)